MRDILASYQHTLPTKRHPLPEYTYVHMARKVVGVGSVGTRAWIILLTGRDDADPLFLQAKEAQESVLERFLGKSEYEEHGERVVRGQRIMQASSDIFLGWQRVQAPQDGVERDFYLRQLHDWKGSLDPEVMVPRGALLYARICGETLARAHARSGDRVAIAAYLGKSDTFEESIADFAEAYAAQNDADYRPSSRRSTPGAWRRRPASDPLGRGSRGCVDFPLLANERIATCRTSPSPPAIEEANRARSAPRCRSTTRPTSRTPTAVSSRRSRPASSTRADGHVVWDNDSYAFLAGDAPASVNPSLWRQSQLVAKQGLYEVVEGIYQVRGSRSLEHHLRRGRHGHHRDRPADLHRDGRRRPRPVPGSTAASGPSSRSSTPTAMSTTSAASSASRARPTSKPGTVQVIAPEGFVEHAVAENVYAGTAMARRAGYMYGAVLARGPQGQVGAGLGQTTSTAARSG